MATVWSLFLRCQSWYTSSRRVHFSSCECFDTWMSTYFQGFAAKMKCRPSQLMWLRDYLSFNTAASKMMSFLNNIDSSPGFKHWGTFIAHIWFQLSALFVKYSVEPHAIMLGIASNQRISEDGSTQTPSPRDSWCFSGTVDSTKVFTYKTSTCECLDHLSSNMFSYTYLRIRPRLYRRASRRAQDHRLGSTTLTALLYYIFLRYTEHNPRHTQP